MVKITSNADLPGYFGCSSTGIPRPSSAISIVLESIKFVGLTEDYLELIGSDSDLSIRCIIEKEKNEKRKEAKEKQSTVCELLVLRPNTASPAMAGKW